MPSSFTDGGELYRSGGLYSKANQYGKSNFKWHQEGF